MDVDESTSVTLLLQRYTQGDALALDVLAKRLYPELKSMARRRVNREQGLGATTLVQETFLKFLTSGGVTPQDRQQFFGLAATIMRHVIVDDARAARSQKREAAEIEYVPELGSDQQQVQAEFLMRVDSALNQLESEDALCAKAFECRYFGGYSINETAEILGVSVRSAERYWSRARAVLAQELGS